MPCAILYATAMDDGKWLHIERLNKEWCYVLYCCCCFCSAINQKPISPIKWMAKTNEIFGSINNTEKRANR